MPGRADLPRGSQGTPARRALCLCAIALALPAGALADDWTLRAALSYAGNRSSEGLSTDAFRQYYQLLFSRPLSEQLSFGLGLDFLDEIGTTTFVSLSGPTAGQELSTRLSQRSLKPYGSLRLRAGDFSLQGAYEYTLNWYLDPVADAMRRRDLSTATGAVGWQPSRDLEVVLSASSFAARDPSYGQESTNLRTALTLDWSFLKRFRLREDLRVTQIESTFLATSDQTTRLSYGPRTELRYDDRFADAVTVSLAYTLDFLQSRDRIVSGGGGGVLVEWIPTVALNGRAEDPTNTTASPPVQNPALIDRNFVARAGPALGPDGASFWNLVADMGRTLDLSQLRVSVRNEDGNPLQFGGLVTWTAYTSTDGQRWVEVPVTAQAFDPVQSNYQIAFGQTSARFFKVVNFGTSTLYTYVTEVQVFSTEVVEGTRTQYTDNLLQIAQGAVTAQVVEKLVLAWSGLLNVNRTSVAAAETTSRDYTNNVSATVGPFGPFTATLSNAWRDSFAPGSGTSDSVTTSALVQYAPIPHFDTSLGASAYQDRVGDVRAETYALTWAGRLRLYDAFRLQWSAAGSRQTVGPSTTDFLGGGTIAELDLFRELRLIARASVSRAVASAGGEPAAGSAVIPRPQQYQIYNLEGRYMTGVQLSLAARVGWVDTVGGTGITQNYRVGWTPFPDGAVQLNMTFETDIDPLTGRTFQRASVWPSWTINRYLTAELTYNLTNLDQSGRPHQRLQSIVATLQLVY